MLLASFQGEGVNERVNEQTRRTFKRFSTSRLQKIFVIRSLGIFKIKHPFVLPRKLACSEVLVRRARKCLTLAALNMKASENSQQMRDIVGLQFLELYANEFFQHAIRLSVVVDSIRLAATAGRQWQVAAEHCPSMLPPPLPRVVRWFFLIQFFLSAGFSKERDTFFGAFLLFYYWISVV